MSAAAIETQGISKQFILRHNRAASLKVHALGLLHQRQREILEPFWALRDVSLTIAQGESVALVGRNGSGKSTLLKLIAGIHHPTRGHLLVTKDARIGTMIELGVGFHPDLNGTENVFLNASIHGLSRGVIEEMYPRIVEYSGLGRFMDVPLKNYSTGMHMRLGFAIAANMDPDILLLDEVFAVGDEDFQKQCLRTIRQFGEEGRTIIFVSHTAAAVRAMCRRVCLLDRGELLFSGSVDDGLAAYARLLVATQPSMPSTSRETKFAPDDSKFGQDAPDELASWKLDLLRREGLASHDHVLDAVVGAAPSETPLAAFVGVDRYVLWQPGAGAPRTSDVSYAIAAPLASSLPLHEVAYALASILRAMTSGARLYVTWFDTSPEDPFEPMLRPSGTVTYRDQPPYQYSFGMLRGLCEALGATADRVSDSTHPRGESVMRITKTPRGVV